MQPFFRCYWSKATDGGKLELLNIKNAPATTILDLEMLVMFSRFNVLIMSLLSIFLIQEARLVAYSR